VRGCRRLRSPAISCGGDQAPARRCIRGTRAEVVRSLRASTVAPRAPRPSSQPADSSGLGCRSALRGSVRAPSPNAPRRHAVVVVHERLLRRACRLDGDIEATPGYQTWQSQGLRSAVPLGAMSRACPRVASRLGAGAGGSRSIRFAPAKRCKVTVGLRIHGVRRVRGDGDIVSSPSDTIARCRASAVSRLTARVRPRGGSRAPGLVGCLAAVRWRHRVRGCPGTGRGLLAWLGFEGERELRLVSATTSLELAPARRDRNQLAAWFGNGDEAWIRGAGRVGGDVGAVGSEDRMSGLGETTCRGAPVEATGRLDSRTLAGCKREERGLGRDPNADRRASRLGGAALCRGRRPLWRHREQPRVLPTRSRGFGGNTVDPGSWGRRASGSDGGGAKHCRVVRVLTVGRRRHRLPRWRVERREASASRSSRNAFGGSRGQCRCARCGSPAGRAPGRARGERGRSMGLRVPRSPARAPGGSSSRDLRGVAHGAEAATGLLEPNAPSGSDLRVRRRGAAGSVVLAQSITPGGLRPNGCGRPQRGIPRRAVTSRVSGGDTANAPDHSPIRFPRARVDSTVEGCG
jgi:hypothetical protein